MTTYPLEIITPNGRILNAQVEALVAPGSEGGFGILANHAPFIASLKAGVLKVAQDNHEQFYALGSGILEVDSSGHVLILADMAISALNREDALGKLQPVTAAHPVAV